MEKIVEDHPILLNLEPIFLKKLLIEDGYSEEKAEYFAKITTDPEFCKKETGRSFHELNLIYGKGLTPEQARYVHENPCIIGPIEECDSFKNDGICVGCINVNGFLYLRTEPNGSLTPTQFLKDLMK